MPSTAALMPFQLKQFGGLTLRCPDATAEYSRYLKTDPREVSAIF